MTTGPTSGNPNVSSRYAEDLLAQLAGHTTLLDMPYDTVVLTGPDVQDIYDPDLLLSPRASYLYFPGGDPTTGLRTEGFSHAEVPDVAAVRRLRDAIPHFSVGQAARDRISPSALWARGTYENLLDWGEGLTALRSIQQVCQRYRLPLAIVQLGDVVQGRDVPPESQSARLYYPALLEPHVALDALRQQVHKLVDGGSLQA